MQYTLHDCIILAKAYKNFLHVIKFVTMFKKYIVQIVFVLFWHNLEFFEHGIVKLHMNKLESIQKKVMLIWSLLFYVSSKDQLLLLLSAVVVVVVVYLLFVVVIVDLLLVVLLLFTFCLLCCCCCLLSVSCVVVVDLLFVVVRHGGYEPQGGPFHNPGIHGPRLQCSVSHHVPPAREGRTEVF